MGKTILTPAQHLVLELAAQERNITDWFYLTGGTALSEFYLRHRLSEDLDFFSEDPIHQEVVDEFIELVSYKTHAHVVKKKFMGHGIYTLQLVDKTTLKLDFVYRPSRELESGKSHHRLSIASLWDIMVDKLYTIFHRAAARDFVDLYYGIGEIGCDLDQLINAMEEKYQARFDRMSLLSRLPIVKDVVDYPKMLVPFDKGKMEQFYLKMVRQMEGEVFR